MTALQVLGSVYIPEVNYIMMILTVVVVAVFKTTIQLGNAYGNSSLHVVHSSRWKQDCSECCSSTYPSSLVTSDSEHSDRLQGVGTCIMKHCVKAVSCDIRHGAL